jgi:hypothetical protein
MKRRGRALARHRSAIRGLTPRRIPDCASRLGKNAQPLSSIRATKKECRARRSSKERSRGCLTIESVTGGRASRPVFPKRARACCMFGSGTLRNRNSDVTAYDVTHAHFAFVARRALHLTPDSASQQSLRAGIRAKGPVLRVRSRVGYRCAWHRQFRTDANALVPFCSGWGRCRMLVAGHLE